MIVILEILVVVLGLCVFEVISSVDVENKEGLLITLLRRKPFVV